MKRRTIVRLVVERVLVVGAACALGCSKAPAPPSAATPATASEPAADAAILSVDASVMDAAVSPAPFGSAAVLDLMLGGHLDALPEQATDPGASFDFNARDNVAPRAGRQLRATSVSVDHGLPPAVVSRIMRSQFGRLRLCYERALAADAKLAGTLVVGFTIDAAGTPSHAAKTGGTLADAPFVSCVERSFDFATYPQPVGAPTSTVSFGLSFAPN